MRNIKLIIEYDGKSFNGWQKQPTKLNIQGEIEKAIEEITGEKVDLTVREFEALKYLAMQPRTNCFKRTSVRESLGI